MDFRKCEVCGRPHVGLASLCVQWNPEYNIFICNECLENVKEVNENLFGKVFINSVVKKITEEEKEMNKMEIKVEESEMFESAHNCATAILVWGREDFKKLHKDICGWNHIGFPTVEEIYDKYPVIEVKKHAVVIWKRPTRPNGMQRYGWDWMQLSHDSGDMYPVYSDVPKAIYDYTNKKYAADGWDYLNNVVTWPESTYRPTYSDYIRYFPNSWSALGYDSFEDMIDDIAKDHGSTGRKYAGEWVDEIYPGTFDGHLIADSYRDCIIDIYDAKTDKHAIINAPCATVYLPNKINADGPIYNYINRINRINELKNKGKDLELTQDEIKWVKDIYKANYEHKKGV